MVQVDNKGHVHFLFDHKTNHQVYLVGDFNNWNESSHPMHQENDQWVMDLQLPPGEYEFKYRVDNLWYNDYAAEKYVPDCWGGENAVVTVLKKHGCRMKIKH